MKENINSKIILIFLAIFIASCWYSLYRKDSENNKYKCETKKVALKGIIENVNHKSGYMTVRVKGSKNSISLNISKTIKNQGFPNYYTYEVGDSIIKEKNSKEFTIKRENKIAVYILDCDD